jgi:hypothetical protein
MRLSGSSNSFAAEPLSMAFWSKLNFPFDEALSMLLWSNWNLPDVVGEAGAEAGVGGDLMLLAEAAGRWVVVVAAREAAVCDVAAGGISGTR